MFQTRSRASSVLTDWPVRDDRRLPVHTALEWVVAPGIFASPRYVVVVRPAANVEVSLPRWPTSPGTAFHGTRLAASSCVLDALTILGFNLFSLASDYATDFGWSLVDTIAFT